MREHYGLEGVPLVIDFIPKRQRAPAALDARPEEPPLRDRRHRVRDRALRPPGRPACFATWRSPRGAACAASGARSRWSRGAAWSPRSGSRCCSWCCSRRRAQPALRAPRRLALPARRRRRRAGARGRARLRARQPRPRDRPVRRGLELAAELPVLSGELIDRALALIPAPARHGARLRRGRAPVVRRRGGGRGPGRDRGRPRAGRPARGRRRRGRRRVRRGARGRARSRPPSYQGVEVTADRRDVATRAGRGLPRDRRRRRRARRDRHRHRRRRRRLARRRPGRDRGPRRAARAPPRRGVRLRRRGRRT